MTSPQILLAIIRGIRPQLRGQSDRVVIALHAYLLSKEYKLVAAGKAAEKLADVNPEAKEVGLEGWQDLDSSYAFAYLSTEGTKQSLLVQALPMDNQLVVNLLAGKDLKPAVSSIDMDKVTTSSTDLIAGYKDLSLMVRQLDAALSAQTGASASSRSTSSSRSSEAKPKDPPIKPRTRLDPGAEDFVPPSGPDPHFGYPHSRTNQGNEPGYLGGMHVGPYDPIFNGSQRTSHGLPAGPYPGVRYDPTNPAGLEGFNAEDFQRGRHAHPDLMPPGEGDSSAFEPFFRQP